MRSRAAGFNQGGGTTTSSELVFERDDAAQTVTSGSVVGDFFGGKPVLNALRGAGKMAAPMQVIPSLRGGGSPGSLYTGAD
jgi:hypothetical protein